MMLADATYADTPKFALPREMPCKVVDVYDADTCQVAVQLFGPDAPPSRFAVRLIGMDTPEIRSRNALEKRAAKAARDELLRIVLGATEPETMTRKKSRATLGESRRLFRLESAGFDKYGRVLGRLYDGDFCVNDAVVARGFARLYAGGTRGVWSEESLLAMLDAA